MMSLYGFPVFYDVIVRQVIIQINKPGLLFYSFCFCLILSEAGYLMVLTTLNAFIFFKSHHEFNKKGERRTEQLLIFPVALGTT